MRLALERRGLRQRSQNRHALVTQTIKDEAERLKALNASVQQQQANLDDEAATVINAAGRGFLGRVVGREKRLENWAAITIQARFRGRIGRMIADDIRWAKVRVAPTSYSLNIVRLRSKISMERGSWLELFDTHTNAFWYLNMKTLHSTWIPPDVFERDLVCLWEPWSHPYTSKAPSNQPCNLKFKTMHEFQTHRKTCHHWHCPACEHRNNALNFPVCSLCGNRLSGDGENLESSLRKNFNRLFDSWKRDEKDKEATQSLPQLEHSSSASNAEDMSVLSLEPSKHPVGFPEEPNMSDDWASAPASGFPDQLQRMHGPASSSQQAIAAQDSTVTHFDDGSCQSKKGEGSSNMLRVCNGFDTGWCTKSTCPLAHPGLRDCAERVFMEGSGTRKVFCVRVCPVAAETGHWDNCPDGARCPHYHPYVRPSTIDIIRKLYPIRVGRRRKEFRSGAVIDGMMNESDWGEANYNGYGIFHWPNGDTFMGMWKDGKREGQGIFRGSSGKEYVGEWKNGLRHGMGVLWHPNGETYTGEFKEGRLCGVGKLTSTNGDVYEGQFLNNRYHGLGRFIKSNGDTYMGYSVRGKAEGMGVLALATGEKYKGRFKNDHRCGKGVCIFPNGEKYSGNWALGHPHGFGIFLSFDGDRFVGSWNQGKKHGKGRYLFSNGDFYDGKFVNDHAQGEGLYRYIQGNMFFGQFQNDMKNGKGTYIWQSGSRYDGWFVNNNINGKGVLKFSNGSKYAGEFSVNKKHGKGIFTWFTGNRYKGEFMDDKMCGFGEMIYKTSSHRYVGQWANNKKNGEGSFYYSDGNIYSGQFRDDVMHGTGKFVYRPGTLMEESYEGHYVNGERHGHGIYRYKKQSGIVYEGSWHKGLRHGKGTLRYSDGKFYRGDFIKERITGRGLFVWPDGSQYEGEWKDNERHGEGNMLFPDGSIFQGRFVHDMKHGPGVLTHADGNSYIGEWENNHIKGEGRFDFIPSEEEGEKVIHLRVFGF